MILAFVITFIVGLIIPFTFLRLPYAGYPFAVCVTFAFRSYVTLPGYLRLRLTVTFTLYYLLRSTVYTHTFTFRLAVYYRFAFLRAFAVRCCCVLAHSRWLQFRCVWIYLRSRFDSAVTFICYLPRSDCSRWFVGSRSFFAVCSRVPSLPAFRLLPVYLRSRPVPHRLCLGTLPLRTRALPAFICTRVAFYFLPLTRCV